MKRFDLYLRRRYTHGEMTVYSLPQRESAHVIHRLVLRSSKPESALLSYLGGGSSLGIGARARRTEKLSNARAEAALGLSSTATGTAEVFDGIKAAIRIGVSETETAKEIFVGCRFAIGMGGEATESGSNKSVGKTALGFILPTQKPKSVKEGACAYTGGMAISAQATGTGAYEAVTAGLAKSLGAAIGITATAEIKRLRLLEELDPETLAAWDGKALEALDYIETPAAAKAKARARKKR